MRRGWGFTLILLLICGAGHAVDRTADTRTEPSAGGGAKTTHAVTLMDEPKYAFGFEHFKYVNPNAPKGGRLREGVNRNPEPNTIPGASKGGGLHGSRNLFESLLFSPSDDHYTSYGKLARSMEIANDCSYVIFNLDERARFNDPENDGCDPAKPANRQPVTAEDVVFTLKNQKENGYYGKDKGLLGMKSAEVDSRGRVMVRLEPLGCKQTIINIGEIPIVPEGFFKKHNLNFNQTTTKRIPGSGPYILDELTTTVVSNKRVCNWWGEDLPVNKGFYNFNRIEYQAYFDYSARREAFKKGEIDTFIDQAKWFPAKGPGDSKLREQIADEKISVHEFTLYGADNIYTMGINSEKPPLNDRNVRRALAEMYPREFLAQALNSQSTDPNDPYYVHSYFPHLKDDPIEDAEAQKLLRAMKAKYGSQFPDEAFDPQTPRAVGDKSYFDIRRERYKRASEYLRKAGWKLEASKENPGVKIWMKDGNKFPELKVPTVGTHFNNTYKQDLALLGIKIKPKPVDTSQRFEAAQKEGDYDLVSMSIFHHDLPNSDMPAMWKTQGPMAWSQTTNITRTKSVVIDELLDRAMEAKTIANQRVALKALDRVLQAENPTILAAQEIKRRLYVNNRFGRGFSLPRKGHVDLWDISPLSWWEEKPPKN